MGRWVARGVKGRGGGERKAITRLRPLITGQMRSGLLLLLLLENRENMYFTSTPLQQRQEINIPAPFRPVEGRKMNILSLLCAEERRKYIFYL